MSGADVSSLVDLSVAVTRDFFTGLLLHEFLKASHENEDWDDEKTEDQGAQDDDKDADGATGTDEVEFHLWVVIVEVHSVHGHCDLDGLFADVSWIILNIWGQT